VRHLKQPKDERVGEKMWQLLAATAGTHEKLLDDQRGSSLARCCRQNAIFYNIYIQQCCTTAAAGIRDAAVSVDSGFGVRCNKGLASAANVVFPPISSLLLHRNRFSMHGIISSRTTELPEALLSVESTQMWVSMALTRVTLPVAAAPLTASFLKQIYRL
jgi:hypothetical protein